MTVHPILKLVAQRIALGLVLLLAVSVLIFAATQILPGDVAQAILGQAATPETLANLREELGLNKPAVTRYFEWLGGILQGDLGTALTNGQDIATSMGKRLGNTIFLAACAAIVAVPLAIILGLLAVRYRNRWPDKLISTVCLTCGLPSRDWAATGRSSTTSSTQRTRSCSSNWPTRCLSMCFARPARP